MGYTYGRGYGHTWRPNRRVAAPAAPAAVGGAGLLVGETNGFATDFTYAVDAQRVAVKTAGAVTAYALDSFYANAGTSPKQVFDVSGNLGWSPHNTCLQSQTFDNASWLKAVCTASANVTAAPNGLVEADAMIPNAGPQRCDFHIGPVTLTGAVNTFSVYAKNGTLGSNWLEIMILATPTLNVWFNLATGAKGTFTGSPVDYTITSVGNGWHRLTVTFIAGAASAITYIAPDMADGSSTGITGGDGVKSACYLWGAQMNRGPTATAHLPTTTAARYGLAVDYDPVTHASKGLLVEPAATNLILNNASMSTQNCTVTAVAYTLSFWGTGTVTLSGVSTAGPLVGTGVNNRVSLTFTPTAGALTCTVTGTVTRAQLETGTVATSPIPTFAATATRTADLVTFLLNTIPALAAEYSLYCRFSTPIVNNVFYPLAISNGTVNEFTGLRATTGVHQLVTDGGVTQAYHGNGTLVANVPIKAAARVKANDFATSAGGVAASTDLAGTLPTLTSVNLSGGSGVAASAVSFHIQQAAIITDRGWSNAELATKSAS